MKIDNDELQREFYSANQHLYPNMTFEEMRECTSTQWLYTRKNIESGELPVIRLQYFGTFLVFRAKAEDMLRKMKIRFDELRMDAKDYFAKKLMIENFLAKYYVDDEVEFIEDEEHE